MSQRGSFQKSLNDLLRINLQIESLLPFIPHASLQNSLSFDMKLFIIVIRDAKRRESPGAPAQGDPLHPKHQREDQAQRRQIRALQSLRGLRTGAADRLQTQRQDARTGLRGLSRSRRGHCGQEQPERISHFRQAHENPVRSQAQQDRGLRREMIAIALFNHPSTKPSLIDPFAIDRTEQIQIKSEASDGIS